MSKNLKAKKKKSTNSWFLISQSNTLHCVWTPEKIISYIFIKINDISLHWSKTETGVLIEKQLIDQTNKQIMLLLC